MKRNILFNNIMTINEKRNYIIRKLRNKDPKKPYYVDKKGHNINSPNTMKYLKKWQLAPGYPEVKIFLNVNDKKNDTFYAVATDLKGRKQQLYTSYHKKVSSDKKYCELMNVGKNYDKLFLIIYKDLKSSRITKNKLIAIILKIMIECQFRPGHTKYRDKYKTFGLTTLQKQHIKNKDNNLFFSFIGKKSVLNECLYKNTNVVPEIKKLLKNKNKTEDVFSHKKLLIKPTDINNYLRKFDGITAKSIRTWDANLEFIKNAKSMSEPITLQKNKRKKQLKDIIEKVAHKLHHTVAICKKSYLDDGIWGMFVEKPDNFKKLFMNNKDSKDTLVKYFEKKCNIVKKRNNKK